MSMFHHHLIAESQKISLHYSFYAMLIALYQKADMQNRKTLEQAFPEFFKDYKNYQESIHRGPSWAELNNWE